VLCRVPLAIQLRPPGMCLCAGCVAGNRTVPFKSLPILRASILARTALRRARVCTTNGEIQLGVSPDNSFVTPSKMVGYLGYCLQKAERLGLPLVVPDRALQKVINGLKDSESLWSAAPAKSIEVLIPNSPSGGFYVETRSYTHYTQPTWVKIENALLLTRSAG
jgi:hypothetical protein